MEVEITSVKENPLLERREVKAEVRHSGEATPSKEDVKSRLAAEKDLEPGNVEVKHIYTGYGSENSTAEIKVLEEFEYEETKEEEAIKSESSEEYEEIVSGTITEAKEALKNMEEPDFEKALTAEKSGKERKTLINWIEDQIE